MSRILSLTLAIVCVSCAPRTPEADVAGTAHDAFFAAIRQHCGEAFTGRIVANDPEPPDDPFVGKRLVMHVRKCGDEEVSIPFHVGDDRSRTWILTRTPGGLRLKHDHRHADGTPDVLTMYGGETVDAGSATRQEFPVDEESRALFRREGREVSLTNVWAMEVESNRFVYELARPGRLFRVEFDLTRSVTPPLPPWGASTMP